MKKSIYISGLKGFIGDNLKRDIKKKNIFLIKNNVKSLKKGETIIHLASKTGTVQSWDNPENYIKTNTDLLLNLLEVCRKKKLNLIFFSSAYLDNKITKLKSNTKMFPSNPYALSKYLCENMCKFFSSEYRLNITVLRLPIIFGYNQNKKFLIPVLLNKLKKNKSINLYGPDVLRNYIFIDDLIEIIHKVIVKQKRKFKLYNLDNKKNYLTNYDVVNFLFKCTESKSKILKKKSRRNEIKKLEINSSEIYKDFKWKPKINFKEGIKKILNDSFKK